MFNRLSNDMNLSLVFFFNLIKTSENPVGKKVLEKKLPKVTQIYLLDDTCIVWELGFCHLFLKKYNIFFLDLTISVIFLFGVAAHVRRPSTWQMSLHLALLSKPYKIF